MIYPLSSDTARCAGTEDPRCADCRRREPSTGEWQAHIPPMVKLGECEFYIAPLLTRKP